MPACSILKSGGSTDKTTGRICHMISQNLSTVFAALLVFTFGYWLALREEKYKSRRRDFIRDYAWPPRPA
jgi:hypothetical protein